MVVPELDPITVRVDAGISGFTTMAVDCAVAELAKRARTVEERILMNG